MTDKIRIKKSFLLKESYGVIDKNEFEVEYEALNVDLFTDSNPEIQKLREINKDDEGNLVISAEDRFSGAIPEYEEIYRGSDFELTYVHWGNIKPLFPEELELVETIDDLKELEEIYGESDYGVELPPVEDMDF